MIGKQQDAYPVGSKVWWRGEELIVTSEPYELHGGSFQDARVFGESTKVTITSPAQHRANLLRWPSTT